MDDNILLTRRYDGETYTFYTNEMISWATGESVKYISCKTPENAFGYSDTVLLNENTWAVNADGYVVGISDSYTAYTLWRYLPKWILKRIEKVMIMLQKKYC